MVNATIMQRQIMNQEELQVTALNAARKKCLETYGPSVIDESTEPIYNETLKGELVQQQILIYYFETFSQETCRLK